MRSTNVNDAKNECSSDPTCHMFYDRSTLNPDFGTQFVMCTRHGFGTNPNFATEIYHGVGILYIKKDYGGN